MLFFYADLIYHELLLELSFLELQYETSGLLFKLSPLGLGGLLQSHELFIVFLAQDQLLLFHLLVHCQIIPRLLLVRSRMEVFRLSIVRLPQCLHSFLQLVFKIPRILLFLC